MDLADVVRPVDRGGVEAEGGPILLLHALPELEQPVDPVACLGLGVGPVELDVSECAVGEQVPLLERADPLGLAAADRQGAGDPFGELHPAAGARQLPLHAAAPREGPGRHHDRLTVGVVERVFEEPALDEVDEAPVAERVPHSRGDVVHRRLRGWRGSRDLLGGDREDRGDDQVDGDDVGDPLGHPGELAEQSARVGHDDRLGHPEAADPARARLGKCGFDDRGPDDGHRQRAAELRDEGELAERLGVGVGVGPTERLGPRAPEIHHPLLHPALAQLLGPPREEVDARGPELASRRRRRTGRGSRCVATLPRCHPVGDEPPRPRRASRPPRRSDPIRAAPPAPRPGGCRRRTRSTPAGSGPGRFVPRPLPARARRPPQPRRARDRAG